MVKAFGYGNGGFEIAKLLEHHKVDYLGVAFADEGISLKNGGIKLPIMVLNPESTSFSAIIQYGLEPEIYSLKGLHAFLKIAKQKNLPPFVIFQDPSLEEMCTHYPISIDELKNISGVGNGKALKFGAQFVDLIKNYVEENDIDRPVDFVVKTTANKSALKVFIIQNIDYTKTNHQFYISEKT